MSNDARPPSDLPAADAELAEAVEQRNLERVQSAIRAGANVNRAIRDQTTNPEVTCSLLHIACRRDFADIARELIQAGADASSRVVSGPTEGETPLIAACRSGQRMAVQELIRAGVDVNYSMRLNGTALANAAAMGHAAIVDDLLRAGANPADPANAKMCEWVFQNDQLEIGMTLANAGAPYNAEKALCLAADANKFEIVHDLLQRGTNPNVKNRYGRTILQELCGGPCDAGYIDVVVALVRAGAEDVDDKAVDFTAQAGRLDVLKELMERKASKQRYLIAYVSAAAAGQVHVIRWLLSKNRNPGALLRALYMAAFADKLEVTAVHNLSFPIVELLLQHGANPNATMSTSTMTLLHYAYDA
ncbi:hypothetical protein CAOG_01848 [Capsaspora owczarzaki ATCC 30864]|uniref:Uncharacterized protein n=1 Tax=Capsaspora owczarzaki (strain ATCC 30864) TaxID=595528 RepID=A0A0D2U5Z8_CAPO3|nr:hypothetical protein CAOG_01848 [Capsaspora owczarzaki ATCC 30864]KJE90546.1 hypothetical protein CAOG_001848 [Capsaspora owczarzaki ATCC 30864]|eukprot:XP_004364716.1 hypothetical protein CAOG_01848 [Capsaspora owczarzaki ATCC 30864]